MKNGKILLGIILTLCIVMQLLPVSLVQAEIDAELPVFVSEVSDLNTEDTVQSGEAAIEETADGDSSKEAPRVVSKGDKTILYIAEYGKDTNSGTIDSPFATIEKARDTIRALKKDGKLGGDGAVVYIRGGEYSITDGIEFTEEDSGTKNAPIVYRNYPDEKVTLIGGVKIGADKFESVEDDVILGKIINESARDNILCVDLFGLGFKDIPELTLPGAYSYSPEMRQIHGKKQPVAVSCELIVDGKAMTIARYPNEGYMYIKEVIEAGSDLRYWDDLRKGEEKYVPSEERVPEPFKVRMEDNRVSYWGNIKNDTLMSGCFMYAWADQTIPIASVDVENNIITSEYPSQYTVKPEGFFYVYNLIEEIDMPGEYYVDREEGKLYLYRPDTGMNSVIYTTLDKYMFTFTGTNYMSIKGIDMTSMRNGAFWIKGGGSKNINIEKCEISFTGNTNQVNGDNCTVYDCYFYDCEGGVNVSGGDRNTLTPANNIVENCEFERCDRLSKTYMSAMFLGGVGNKAKNNEMHDSQHTVFRFNGNDNEVSYNEIYDACTKADDMGAIYTGRSLTQRGHKLINNYIHDVGNNEDLGAFGAHGIFLDDYWSAALVEGNVFENISGSGIKLSGSHNVVNNNLFVGTKMPAAALISSYDYTGDSSKAMEAEFRNDLAKVPYTSDIWLQKYPEMKNVIGEDGLLDINNNITVTNNMIYNSPNIEVRGNILETIVLENNIDLSSDPEVKGAYDAEKLLREDSVIYKKNPDFKFIDFERIGTYSKRAEKISRKAYVFCADSPYIKAKGQKIKDERNGTIVRNGVMYISVRTGASVVGGSVTYDGATEKVEFGTNEKTVSFIDAKVSDTVIFNDTEYVLTKPIVNIENVNYISLNDLATIFEKKIIQKNNAAVITDVEDLFEDASDDGLLRYLTQQLSIY